VQSDAEIAPSAHSDVHVATGRSISCPCSQPQLSSCTIRKQQTIWLMHTARYSRRSPGAQEEEEEEEEGEEEEEEEEASQAEDPRAVAKVSHTPVNCSRT